MTGPATGARILHVEDEQLNRTLLRAVLDRSGDPRIKGARLGEAATLQGARDYLADNDVDLVLLDVRLPDGNGLDLARELKAGDRDVSVVVMSASVLPHERQEATNAGCDAFVSKPYLAKDLLDTIGRLLPGGE